MFLGGLVLWGLVVVLVVGWMGIVRLCLVVERFVGLVGKVDVALVLGSIGFVLESVGGVLCLWRVVESYISE